MVVLVQQVGLLCDVKHAHHTVTWIHHMGVWLSIWRQCCLHYRNRPMQRNHTPNQPTTGKGKLWMQNSLRTQKVISRWVLVECFPNPSKTQWICNAGSKFSISHILQLTLTATHVCFFLFKSKYWISLSGDFFVKNVPEVFFEPFTLDLFQDLSQLQEIWIAEGEKYLKVSQKYFGVELRGIIMCLSHESIWSFFCGNVACFCFTSWVYFLCVVAKFTFIFGPFGQCFHQVLCFQRQATNNLRSRKIW